MRRFYILFCLLFLALSGISCEQDVLYGRRPVNSGGGHPAPDSGEEVGEESPPEIHEVPVYNFAVAEYPAGYDWIRDPDYGIIDCSVTLFMNGTPSLSFKAGHDCLVSTDLDMARCIGEHVYTDYSTSAETVVKKDGEEIFRYQGREMLVGFILDDLMGVHTAGVPRDGDGTGWTLRINGEPSAFSKNGEIVSSLHIDGNMPAFAFIERHDLISGTDTTWHIYRKGTAEEVVFPDDDEILTDFLCADGIGYVLSWNRRTGAIMLYRDGEGQELKPSGGESCRPEALLSDGAGIYVLGRTAGSGISCRYTLWKDGDVLLDFEDGFTVTACWPDGEHLGATGYYEDDRRSQYLFLDGEYIALPPGYGLAAPSHGSFLHGHYCLCLSPMEPDMHPIWILDGVKTGLEINGCFLGLGHTWKQTLSP